MRCNARVLLRILQVIAVVAALCLPTIARHDAQAIARPLWSTSRYMHTANALQSYRMGCALGNRDLNEPGTQQSFVTLLYGEQVRNTVAPSGVWGVSLFDQKFTLNAAVVNSAVNFAKGYWLCTRGDLGSNVVTGIGTSNDGDYFNVQGGNAWYGVVVDANASLAELGIGQAQFYGAIDAELLYNTASATRDWLDQGFNRDNGNTTFTWITDVGDANSCPQTVNTSVNGACANGWHQSDVVHISEFDFSFAVPEIYSTGGGNAKQWDSLTRWGFAHSSSSWGAPIGVLTEYKACLQRGNCSGINNTPAAGWAQYTSIAMADPIYLTDISNENCPTTTCVDGGET